MAKIIYIPPDVVFRADNEDWIRMLSRDVDSKGKEIPNRFDTLARERGEKFVPIRQRKPKKAGH